MITWCGSIQDRDRAGEGGKLFYFILYLASATFFAITILENKIKYAADKSGRGGETLSARVALQGAACPGLGWPGPGPEPEPGLGAACLGWAGLGLDWGLAGAWLGLGLAGCD